MSIHTMHAEHALGFWPGLPRLWYRGEIPALLLAILFALALNMALLATFLWPEWLSPWSTRLLWLALAIASPVAAARNYFYWNEITTTPAPSEDAEDAFLEAQTFYLRGDYFEAEAALHRIFTKGKPDIEAAILMISILRRTRRWAQALHCIDRLLLLDHAAPWRYELTLERTQIAKLAEKAESAPVSPEPDTPTTPETSSPTSRSRESSSLPTT